MRKLSNVGVALVIGAMFFVADADIASADSYHYDTDTIPVSSISVGTGTGLGPCTGGGLAVSSFNNRIDAGQSNCYPRYYDGANFTTFLQKHNPNVYSTLSAGNRNRTSSILYGAS